MKRMKFTVTLADVQALKPCFDPGTVTKRKRATLVEILGMKTVKPVDRIWAVKHFVDDKTLRLFAAWCAEQALKLDPKPDPRSLEAVRVAKKYAHGKASDEERRVAAVGALAAWREKWNAYAAYAAAYAAYAAYAAAAAYADAAYAAAYAAYADAAAYAYAYAYAAAADAARRTAAREEFLNKAVKHLSRIILNNRRKR